MRVLVVDDDPMICKAVQRLLSSEHDVTVRSSAVTALDEIRGGARFDAILSDLMMPEVTGLDFYQALAREAPEQARHLGFITGGAFTESSREQLGDSARPHIEKPFDAAALRAFVAALRV